VPDAFARSRTQGCGIQFTVAFRFYLIVKENHAVRPVSINVPHSLGQAEARRRIEAGFGNARQQMSGGLGEMLNFTDRWEGDRLHFDAGGLGQKIAGRLDVLPDAVRIEVDLPGMLAVIAERLAGTLKQETQKLLGK
jgi:hypothetical protein